MQQMQRTYGWDFSVSYETLNIILETNSHILFEFSQGHVFGDGELSYLFCSYHRDLEKLLIN